MVARSGRRPQDGSGIAVTQSTQVVLLKEPESVRLAEQLRDAGFEFRAVPHARFSARAEGVVATCYKSGKLVLQGVGVGEFLIRYLPEHSTAREEASDAPREPQDALGSDEAGKGDTFGPLTVAAVAVSVEKVELLKEAGVTDSKKLSDKRIRLLAPWLREQFPTAELSLLPEIYNQRYDGGTQNVNRLLTGMHLKVLGDLQAETGIRRAVVDKFGRQSPVRASARLAKLPLEVEEIVRAELAEPAVAAASVLARERFLVELEQLSAEWAVDLPRGSGSPVPPALRRFLDTHGVDALPNVAKMHFKNVAAAIDRWR